MSSNSTSPGGGGLSPENIVREDKKREEILVNIESNDSQPELLGNLTSVNQIDN